MRGERGPPESARSPLTAVLAVAVMLPSILPTYPTGSDLSLHAYAISALRHWGDGFFPAGLFRLNLGHPNQLFSFLAVALATILPMTVALQVAAGICSASIVLGVSRIVRHLELSEWVLGLVVAASFGLSFYFGMQAYFLGTGIMFGSLVELEHFNQRPTWAGWVKVVGALVLLHFAHQMALLFFAAIGLLFALGSARSWRGLLARSTVFLLGAAATLVQLRLQASDMAEVVVTDAALISMPIRDRLRGLPWALFGAHERVTAFTLCASWAAAFAALVVVRWRTDRPSRPVLCRGDLWRWRYPILAASCLGLFLFGPNCYNTANYLAERFLPWGAMFSAIAISPRRNSLLPRLLRAALGLFPFALGAAIAPAVLETEAEAIALQQIAAFVQPSSAIAMLDVDIRPRHEPFSSLMGDAYLAAQTGGRPLHSFCYTTISVVQFSKGALWRDSSQRMLAPRSLNFRPALDFTAFRYVLIRTDSLFKSQLFARLLEPEGRFVIHAGRWTLIESNLDVRPPNVEFGKPGYCGDRLYDRLMAVRDLIEERDFLATGAVLGGQCTLKGGMVGLDALAVKSFLADEDAKALAAAKRLSEAESAVTPREPSVRPAGEPE